MLNFKGQINITGFHKYNSTEMKKAISEHFYEICYLCDRHIDLMDFEPEHFFPKGENFFPEKKNEHENLFYSCKRCNQIKSYTYNSKPEKNILNSKTDDIENLIILRIDDENKEIANKINIEINSEISDENLKLKCKNTKELLNKIYNAENTKSTFGIGKFRKNIKTEIGRFNKLLDNYNKTKLKKVYLSKLKKYISKKNKNKEFSNFVSFKRQIIKDNKIYLNKLKQYFD